MLNPTPQEGYTDFSPGQASEFPDTEIGFPERRFESDERIPGTMNLERRFRVQDRVQVEPSLS